MRWKIRKPYAKRRALHFWHLWFAWYPVRVPTRGRGAGQTLVWLAYVCRKGKLRYTIFNKNIYKDYSGGSSIMTEKNIENAVDQIGKSFNSTVTERINMQPEFRREVLKQVIECISRDDLKVAQAMLDQVIEADEGVDK